MAATWCGLLAGGGLGAVSVAGESVSSFNSGAVTVFSGSVVVAVVAAHGSAPALVSIRIKSSAPAIRGVAGTTLPFAITSRTVISKHGVARPGIANLMATDPVTVTCTGPRIPAGAGGVCTATTIRDDAGQPTPTPGGPPPRPVPTPP